ncbi:MAG: hypothetical protein Q9196_003801 [Gyalolechia fulgens]
MSCLLTEAIDCLYQTAPHIILFEPTQAHSRHDLYHEMLASERRILEQSKKRTHTFPHSVTKRVCQWYRRCTKTAEKEECEALELFKSARSKKPAAAYDANASTQHLESKKMKSREMVKMSVETCEAGFDEDDGMASREARSISVTETAISPSASSFSSTTVSTVSTLPSSFHSSTDTVVHYRRPSLDLSIDSCDECHQMIPAEERRALLVEWGQVESEELEALGRKWWKRFSMRRR